LFVAAAVVVTCCREETLEFCVQLWNTKCVCNVLLPLI
jgi:hypothetical protein